MADTMEKKIQDFKTAMAAMLANAPLEVDTELVQKLKNIEDLPLNEITQDVLIEQFYDMGEYLNVDTRQGSIYWDASMGSIIRTSTFLEQLKIPDQERPECRWMRRASNLEKHSAQMKNLIVEICVM